MRLINDAQIEIKDKEFVITRLFNAPRELVFKVWTKPEHIKKWWGPHTLTGGRIEIDLRPGGEYLYTMITPEGQELPPYQGKFMDITPNEKIAYSIDAFHQADMWKARIGHLVGPEVDFSTLQSFVTVLFEDAGDKTTRLTFTQKFISNEVRDAIGLMAAEGWTQSLQKLAGLLSA